MRTQHMGRDVRMSEGEYRAARAQDAVRHALWSGQCTALAPDHCGNPPSPESRVSMTYCVEHDALAWAAITRIQSQWVAAILRERALMRASRDFKVPYASVRHVGTRYDDDGTATLILAVNGRQTFYSAEDM